MKAKRFYVYIMTNRRNGTLYTGVTNDVVRRVWQHKDKINPNAFTARYNCSMIVYFEDFKSINDAIDREKYIKSKSRDFKIKLIESINPQWQDLSLNCEFWM